MSTAAFQKLHKLNWYLTEENVIFSLCSKNIAISKESRQQMPVLQQSFDQNMHLIDLVGPESWFIFEALGLKHDWLQKHVTEWDMSTSYQEMKSFVNSVKVVNDAAERGVKLNTDYAAILTDYPQQLERILQAVEDHRKRFPEFSKAALSKSFKTLFYFCTASGCFICKKCASL